MLLIDGDIELVWDTEKKELYRYNPETDIGVKMDSTLEMTAKFCPYIEHIGETEIKPNWI